MFEKFDIDNLYFCTIVDIIPNEIKNNKGCIAINGIYGNSYDTILYLCGDKFYDINHMNRIINVIHFPQTRIPEISDNHHLYSICEETLVSYRERIDTPKNKLRRLPFGLNVRY